MPGRLDEFAGFRQGMDEGIPLAGPGGFWAYVFKAEAQAVVAQHTGADSASVIYDAVEASIARGIDVLIADTAGRLHTHTGLMEELKKVARVTAKLMPSAPHETLLVMDAGTGQNALAQASQFHQALGVTGLVVNACV